MVVSVVFEHDDGGRRVAPLMVTVVNMNLMVATPMPVVIMAAIIGAIDTTVSASKSQAAQMCGGQHGALLLAFGVV